MAEQGIFRLGVEQNNKRIVGDLRLTSSLPIGAWLYRGVLSFPVQSPVAVERLHGHVMLLDALVYPSGTSSRVWITGW